MFRRFVAFLFFLILVGAIVGAIIATGLAAFSGINRWLIVVATAVGLIGFGLIARQLFRTTWAPVGELIDATRRLGEGDHEVRLSTRGARLSDRLAQSFNKMAERLQEEDRRRRRLIADIGHELRTPMTVIRGEIEAVLDGLHRPEQLSDVVDEIEVIERLLEDLRLASMAEAGTLQLETEPTDIAEVVTAVAASFRGRAAAQRVVMSVEGDSPTELSVDPHRIHQVMSNLVRNALDQMPDGGRLEVIVEAEPEGVHVVIADTGPGIPVHDLDRVFDRFVRSPDSNGTGLGLSISRDLIEAHGGTIEATNRATVGTELRVYLPAKP